MSDGLDRALELLDDARGHSERVDAKLSLARDSLQKARDSDSRQFTRLNTDDARYHLRSAVDIASDDDVGVPLRNALQILVAETGGGLGV